MLLFGNSPEGSNMRQLSFYRFVKIIGHFGNICIKLQHCGLIFVIGINNS